MSTGVGVEWNGLAGLMDISYSQREEIRKKQAKYSDPFSKAEKIFYFSMIAKISVVRSTRKMGRRAKPT